jgi:hypothetical protein
MMTLMLEIQREYLVDKLKDQTSTSIYAKDYIRLIADTMIGVWLLSQTKNSQLWITLGNEIKSCRYSVHYIKSWSSYLHQLTKLMVEKIYGMKLTVPVTLGKEIIRGKVRKGAISPTSNRLQLSDTISKVPELPTKVTALAPSGQNLKRSLSVDRGNKKEQLTLSSNLLAGYKSTTLNDGYEGITQVAEFN